MHDSEKASPPSPQMSTPASVKDANPNVNVNAQPIKPAMLNSDSEKGLPSSTQVLATAPAPINADAERRLVRKIDLHVYPILFLVYALSFLDRINISNARIQGLTEDLDLYGNRFNIALFVYFIPYVLLEVPSNMIIKKMRPSYYLASLMAAWGIVNMCMGFVKSYEGLVVLRFFLGVLEAGVMPGIIYLTSMYYKRHEFQKRMSFYFCSVLAAGAFGGLLAYGISHLDGHRGLRAWRWIFIIEGAATAFISIVSVFLIVDWPDQCRFLNTEEKQLLRLRLADDGTELARMDTLNRYAYKLIFSDWKIWLGSLVYMGIGITGYSTVYFMPTILLEFGWTAEAAQLHTVPVYVVTAVGMLGAAYLSDRFKHRYGFIMLGAAIATIGYAMLLNQANLSRDAKYTAIFLASIGGYMGTPIALAWLTNNISGHWKRAFGSGIQITIGNCAGIIAANIFVTQESPRYPTGYGTALGLTWLGALAATLLVVYLALENRKRAAGEGDGRLSQPKEELDNMGDYHPSFQFTL
ncbi:Uu.00g061970.m01.CDS01 [Anthostomella pinea]|uniref:Uu.00g061970.m01.CDS01 n=1 Tax=Anthostomella pinea TaxID=933095 RepID=A0AAI8VSJ7_9PEZI|nr:Uu.00g061970.m01.CDS01 [Anthostomella pinea]